MILQSQRENKISFSPNLGRKIPENLISLASSSMDKSRDVKKIIDIVKRCSPMTQRKHYDFIKEIKLDSLAQALENKDLVEEFREFLKTEYSAENLDFYFICEKYEKMPKKKQQKFARKVYNNFIVDNAEKEVNLDFCIKETIRKNLHNPNSKTFTEAKEYVFNLMESDSFKRFKYATKNPGQVHSCCQRPSYKAINVTKL